MANQIRMSPDQMRQRASQYGAEAENLKGIILRMDQLLSNLQSEWEGAASESYAARYEDLRPGFQKAEELIRDIQAALGASANALEETDAAIAAQFR